MGRDREDGETGFVIGGEMGDSWHWFGGGGGSMQKNGLGWSNRN